MKCELCNNIATEKHHTWYFPEKTMGVCGFHGDEVHTNPMYSHLVSYPKGDAQIFYTQQSRIDKFLKRMSKRKRNYR